MAIQQWLWTILLGSIIIPASQAQVLGPRTGVTHKAAPRIIGETYNFPQAFAKTNITVDANVNGNGNNIDSIDFYNAADPNNDLMFVTSKSTCSGLADRCVEVWKHPYTTQTDTITQAEADNRFNSGNVNGVVVDNIDDKLYISVGNTENAVVKFSLPAITWDATFTGGAWGSLHIEPNLSFSHTNANADRIFLGKDDGGAGSDSILVLDNSGNTLDRWQATGGAGQPGGADGIETSAADSFYQAIYIPDENGQSGVYAYSFDGTAYNNGADNRFGDSDFTADAEGIVIYKCPNAYEDNGRGLIVVAEQQTDTTEFNVYDRVTWDYLGTFQLLGIANTDGIASNQVLTGTYPSGVFAALDNDASVGLVGWDVIFDSTGVYGAQPTPPYDPPVEAPDTYTNMRATACTVGEEAELTDAVAGGTFRCTANANALRTPYFDDGGIQISSATAGNHWKRLFAHTEAVPIEMDWYEWVADQARIDTFFANLINDFSNLYIKAPTTAVPLDTLTWSAQVMTASNAINTFVLLESDQAIDIVTSGAATAKVAFGIAEYETVKIGGDLLNLRWVGQHPGADCAYPLPADTKCSDPPDQFLNGSEVRGVVSFRQTNGADTLIWKANGLDCDDHCIDHSGSNGAKTHYATIVGTFDNAGVRINSAVSKLLDINITLTDPHARGQGWDGTAYPNNQDCGTGGAGSDEKGSGLWTQRVDSLTGSLTLRYGGQRWFQQGVDYIGKSTSDRFAIEYDSLGWTGPGSLTPGTQVDTDGCRMQGGKADGAGDELGGRQTTRFMSITEQVGSSFARDYSFLMEATGVSLTCCYDIEASGMQAQMLIGEENAGEHVDEIILRGGAAANTGPLTLVSDSLTVIGGTWDDINIGTEVNTSGPHLIQNATLTGVIDFIGVPDEVVTLDNITFSGGVRAVVTMDAGGSYEVQIPATGKLSAASGSTITNTGGGATLRCSGNVQSLPYTFDGTTDDCEQ